MRAGDIYADNSAERVIREGKGSSQSKMQRAKRILRRVLEGMQARMRWKWSGEGGRT